MGRQGSGGSLSSSGDESGEWVQFSTSMNLGRCGRRQRGAAVRGRRGRRRRGQLVAGGGAGSCWQTAARTAGSRRRRRHLVAAGCAATWWRVSLVVDGGTRSVF